MMNNYFKNSVLSLSLALIVFVFVNPDKFFEKDEISEDITRTMQTGDYQALASYFSNIVELDFMGDENIYSKNQAKLIIRNFFNTNKPDHFVIKQSGDIKNSAYSIGMLTTSTGSFRIFLLLKNTDTKPIIYHMRFEKC